MGYITKTIKAPAPEAPGWFICKAGATGVPVKAAFFGTVREVVEARAEDWLQKHPPSKRRPILRIVK